MALSLAADGNSWDHYAKGTPSPHCGGSDRLQAHDFRVCFTPLLEVLFTFPSRYWFAVGLPVVFSLAGWSPRIRAGFLVSRLTQERPRLSSGFRLRASHPLRGGFPAPSASLPRAFAGRPTTPARALRRRRFGLVRFRSPLLAQSLLLSLPPGTEMFQFPGLASPFSGDAGVFRPRVAPFGHPRICGHLPLRAAFRSLSRPSSPPGAKASFMRPCLLSLVLFAIDRHQAHPGLRGLQLDTASEVPPGIPPSAPTVCFA